MASVEPEPHRIRDFKPNKLRFFENDDYKIKILHEFEISVVDGYYCIKSIVSTLFNNYFTNSELFLKDVDENDRIPMIYMAADTLIGSLLQFLSTEKEIVNIKYLVVVKNKSMLKLKGMFGGEILNNLRASGFKSDLEKIQKIMGELVELGYVEMRNVSKNVLKIGKEMEKTGKKGQFFYKWIKNFELSPEGQNFYKKNIHQVIVWAVQLWRSLYNIRELDVVIPEKYKFRTFLEKTVAKAATQGFMSSYWVVKNLQKYYKLVIEDDLKKG
ncbi:MAG: hypothetical protein ACTSWY_03020 [Promethearchaeota archaeon]